MSAASLGKLKNMVSSAPGQVQEIGNSVGQVQEQVDDTAEEIAAITDNVTDVTEADARDIIDNQILSDKGGDYVSYGSNFGQIDWDPRGNLTDWEIIKDITPTPPPVLPAVPTVIYTYTPGDYPDLDEWVNDFAFAVDYLTRPLTDGASYGLKPYKANLEYAESILTENQNKVSNSIDVFNRYL